MPALPMPTPRGRFQRQVGKAASHAFKAVSQLRGKVPLNDTPPPATASCARPRAMRVREHEDEGGWRKAGPAGDGKPAETVRGEEGWEHSDR